MGFILENGTFSNQKVLEKVTPTNYNQQMNFPKPYEKEKLPKKSLESSKPLISHVGVLSSIIQILQIKSSTIRVAFDLHFMYDLGQITNRQKHILELEPLAYLLR